MSDEANCPNCGSDDKAVTMTDDGITTTPDDGSPGNCRNSWHTASAERDRINKLLEKTRSPYSEAIGFKAGEELAALARRLLEERDAEQKDNDHNVETIKLLGERIASLERERDEALVRIQNEIAARRLAQEGGIGDRARIEELERELEEAEHKLATYDDMYPPEEVR